MNAEKPQAEIERTLNIEKLLGCPDTVWKAVSMESFKDSPRFKTESHQEYYGRKTMEADLMGRHIARLAVGGNDKALGEIMGKQIRDYLTSLAQSMADDLPDPESKAADDAIEAANYAQIEKGRAA